MQCIDELSHFTIHLLPFPLLPHTLHTTGIGVRSKGGANHLCKVFVEPDSDGAGAAIEQVVFHLPQTFPNNKIVASGEGPYHFQVRVCSDIACDISTVHHAPWRTAHRESARTVNQRAP